MNHDNVVNLKQTLTRDGYLHIKKAIPVEKIKPIEDTVLKLFSMAALKGENIHQTIFRLNQENHALLYRIYKIISRSISLASVREACSPYIKAIYQNEVHFDMAPGMLMSIPYDSRIVYDWHQEISYHPDLYEAIHLWLPLFESSSKENGTMSALKGSHILGPLPFETKAKMISNSTTSFVPKDINIYKEKFEEVFFFADPGDLVILHPYVIHRSNDNKGEKSRFTCSFRIAAIQSIPEVVDF